MSRRTVNILLSVISVGIGGCFYLIFRKDAHITAFVEQFLDLSRIQQQLTTEAGRILCYYLPDCLWGFGLCCGLVAIYNPGKMGILICGGITFLCGCGWELLQYMEIVSGTGDFWDVLGYLLASLLCISINRKRRKEQ